METRDTGKHAEKDKAVPRKVNEPRRNLEKAELTKLRNLVADTSKSCTLATWNKQKQAINDCTRHT